MARGLVVETRAHSNHYKGPDVRGMTPFCTNDSCTVLTTCLNTQKMVDRINESFNSGHIKLNAVESTDAGRYVPVYCVNVISAHHDIC